MDIVEKLIGEIKPYENNPRKNDGAVDVVEKSIKEFGFKVPIVVDSDNIIVCGHTRYKAAKKLGLKKVPCVVADDLTPEQIKAFRLADNKTAELASWDFGKLDEELAKIVDVDMTEFNFYLDNVNLDDMFEDDDANHKNNKKKVIICPHCGSSF